MSLVLNRPAYITFTGVDDVESIAEMQTLSARYPIEWGVLLDPARHGEVLFPAIDVRDAVARAGLRLSVHVCGEAATAIVRGQNPPLALGGFSRLQINHGRTGSGPLEIEHARNYAARLGMRAVLQCQGPFPDDAGVDWLYDRSFGTGAPAHDWPALSRSSPFCGYSGGLRPENVRERLIRAAVPRDVIYWIDMESGVRTDGRFDTAKCAAVCAAVYGS